MLLRSQRQLARLSLRALSELTNVSDSYLSQVERGLHEPSPDVLKSIAAALKIPLGGLYERLGWLDDAGVASEQVAPGVEEAIAADPKLTAGQKRTLREVYLTLVDRDA